MEETFKPIQGFEDYKISNLGNIISYKRKVPFFLKPQQDRMGYLHVRLYGEESYGKPIREAYKRPRLYKVHRLVLETFDPEGRTEDKNHTNHINGIKTDNRLENLEWTSQSDNIQHAYVAGLHDEGLIIRSKKKRKPVKAILPDGTVHYFNSRIHASLFFECANLVVISSIKAGTTVSKGKLKGIRFEDCPVLPVGETFTKILNIEEKLLKYRLEHNRLRKNDNYYMSKLLEMKESCDTGK